MKAVRAMASTEQTAQNVSVTGGSRQGSGRLYGLLVSQFFGAFNDNAWKFIVILFGARGLSEADSQSWTTLTILVLTAPLMLVSLPAGVLADRYSKRSIIVSLKVVEILLMGAATAALFLWPSAPVAALCVLGCMGAQSALFGPAKYGILPELVPHDRLSCSNGYLEMWTFLAIIAGSAVGPVLLNVTGAQAWIAPAVLTLLAVIGWYFARWIPAVPAARTEGGIAVSTAAAWRAARSERVLWLSIVGIAFFWAVATLTGQELTLYAKDVLELSEAYAGLPFAVFGIGVGVGSVLAGRLSAHKVEYGLIPVGAGGFSFSLLLVGAFAPTFWWLLALMLPTGISCGLLLVPLNAILQWRAPAERRGAVIALANAIAFGGMIVGTLAAGALANLGVTITEQFLAAGVLGAVGTVWAVCLVPDSFLRFLLIVLTHSIYRLKVLGRTHVPQKGGALLVPNHVSFADGLFLLASVDRPIRFIVDSNYFHHPLLKPFMKSLGAIPISASEGPRVVLRALREAGQYLDDGHLVCIFAEGQITRTGMLLPFRRGLERIVKGREAPIIPVHLDGVWGSVFSHAGGRFITKMPAHIPYPVTVAFGASLPNGTPVQEVRQAVAELGEEAWTDRALNRAPLHHTFIQRARRHPLRPVFADAARSKVSKFSALVGIVALARALRKDWAGQKNVGILMPPTIAGAFANVAAALAGRTSVNLNFTVGKDSLESAIRQSDLKTVLTSRKFIDKVQIELPDDVRTIWIEDVAAGIGVFSKAFATLASALAPRRMLERLCGAERQVNVTDVVTIIFSSGSTGEPKGVMLTHANVDANVEGVSQVTRVSHRDRILGILPHFHSFGYMALWFASNRDLATVFHPNPLDPSAVGQLVHRFNVTVLIATPTFLQLYLRRCTPAQFGSLRIVLVGAEKLSNRLAGAFEERFGVKPLEGYGTTECSPGVTVNVPDYRAPGFYQPGSRRGTVGQPLPGVALRIVDPDSMAPAGQGEPGLILVRGPNVMLGYLGRDDLTQKVIQDGWYVTGDIGVLDDDGFLRITDRLSRFSKIGGEMVPHGRVEEALQQAAGEDLQVFAVTSVADAKKGEKLIVLHTLEVDAIPAILEQAVAEGLPNLFTPKIDQFLRVDELPVLGTGKLDLRRVKEIAKEAFPQSTPA